MRIALTDMAIRKLTPPEKGQLKVWDTKLPGFGVVVGKRTKTFTVVYGEDRRNKSIGRYPQISLSDARKEAMAVLAHPGTQTRQSVQFSDAKKMFLADCEARLRTTTVDRYRFALMGITDKPLDDISTKITDPNQLKALKAMFNWCIDHNLTDRNPFIRRRVIFNTRERLLTDDEVASILSYDHKPYSDIVKLLFMTGQRRNQIWKFDPKWQTDELITFPSTVMKSKREHIIPITGYGSLLQSFTFNGWSKSKVRMDKHTKVTDWVLHDARRYFSTTMAKLGTPLHITEQILDHRSTVSGVAKIYNLYQFVDEMREALENYERHLQSITT